MSFLSIIYKNLKYFWRSNLNVLFGICLSSAILIGGLTLGDSIKYSLNQTVAQRLGKTEYVMVSSGRFFLSSLAERMKKMLNTDITSLLFLKGNALNDTGDKRFFSINIYGVTNDFWKFGNSGIQIDDFSEEEIVINQRLANELGLKPNDEFVLKIEKNKFIPLDAPFSPDDQNYVSVRMKVKIIANPEQFGNFNLLNSQITPCNAFVSLSKLAKIMSLDNYANILLIDNFKGNENDIHRTINNIWSFADINLNFREIKEFNQTEMISKRIFIEDTLQNLICKSSAEAKPVLTYLVNSIKSKNYSIPYSFASSIGKWIDSGLKDDEIILNEWAAEDIHAKKGDTIEVSYFTLGPLKKLIEKTHKFILKSVIPNKNIDRYLMPEFEGIAKVDKCSNWETGIPVDFKKIRPKDEEYWKKYRGTPKAFITQNTAEKIWQTKFGKSTAIRFHNTVDTSLIKQKILSDLNPSSVGFNIVPVKQIGTFSANNGVDFGQLFISLSFFLLLGAIILTITLFSLNIDLRSKEQGILLALGFSKNQVQKLLLSEGLILATIGSVLGILLAYIFNKLILYFLNSIWYDVIRTTSIHIHFNISTILTGVILSILIAFIAMLITIRKKAGYTINDLQRRNYLLDFSKYSSKTKKSMITLYISLSSILILLFYTIYTKKTDTAIFFILGTLLLISFLAFYNRLLIQIQKNFSHDISLSKVSIKNLGFHRKRSLATISLLAIGTFLVIATGLNRTDYSVNAHARTSGTGGFLFFAENTIPIIYNLNSKEGKEKSGIESISDSVSFVQIRSIAGDDASCLNINRVSKPRIISVNPMEFSKRKAFSFQQTLKGISDTNVWMHLDKPLSSNVIPAVADQTVIQWGIGKSVGDTLKYVNEKGDTIYLKLIAGLSNSVFQGNVIISEENFLKHFPGISGSNIFLIDAPENDSAKIKSIISTAFQNHGIIFESASARLNMFNSVTNTYLDIFLAFGSLGLIIGTIGIAILLIRNIIEQRYELAMLNVLGIERKNIFKIILISNTILLITGMFTGFITAFLAALPSILTVSKGIPYSFVAVILSIIIINGLIWILALTNYGLKQNALNTIKNE